MDCSDAKRKVLLETIGGELLPDELSLVKFLISDVFPDRNLQKFTTGSTLLVAIATNGRDDHVVECLARAGRKDLAAKYCKNCRQEELYENVIKNLEDLTQTCLPEFRVILVCIADELTDDEDLPKLKSITSNIPKRALGKATTVLDFLSLLIKEKKLEPQTLDTALLEPLHHLRITDWVKHSEKISEFKKRLDLRAIEEIEGSRGSPVTGVVYEPQEAQKSQSSDEGNEQVQPQEKESEMAETQESQNSEEENENKEHPPKTEDGVAESEPSQINEEEKDIPEQSQETEDGVAESEPSQINEEEKDISEQSQENPEKESESTEPADSNSCKEKRKTQAHAQEKGQNEPQPDNADIEEKGGSKSDLEEETILDDREVPGHSNTGKERSKPESDTTHIHKTFTVYRPVKNVRLEEYRMTRKPRGKAVIFNIENFRKSPNSDGHLTDRKGSSVDASGLVKIFRNLHFDVERFDDVSFNEIDGRLRNLGYETDHENVDCLAIFILTHGQNGKLLDADGSAFDLTQQRKYFQASKCVTLAGKPKMFFIQACQGPANQGSYNHLEKDAVTVKPSPPSPPASTSTQPEEKQSPDEADFLICNSTPPGYVSFRDTSKGSWFISTFIETLERDGNSFDLMEILARTNRVLGDKTGRIDGIPCAQIASITSTLRRKVFLRTLPSN